MTYHIVIPARMASERLPGKPLLKIGRRTLIEWVCRRAEASRARSVTVATDSDEIARAVKGFGARAVMTSEHHTSGSDRIAECADIMGWSDDTLIVNLQGDEPLMPPACLDQVAGLAADDTRAAVASLYWPIEEEQELRDPNAVKVVTARDGAALYFSRSIIPHPRGGTLGELTVPSWKRHIGLYAFRAGALRAFSATPPTPLESMEKLEQLRFLETGRRIAMAEACEMIPAGVDTPEDLERVSALMSEES
jgi:3-deoxy-manno-octulosonate cytidylyltransferase (CMP-KDO synthetase)